jgi:hypothetical protein
MASRSGLTRVVAGVVVAGALSLTSLVSGVVSADADINIGVGELQECTISKSMEMGDGDVDGRDFLVWQRGHAVPSASAGDLADWQANYGVGN